MTHINLKVKLWIALWLDLLDSIIGIVTFLGWYPHFGMRFRIWFSKRDLIKRIDIKYKEENDG